MKTAELMYDALDLAVAKADGVEVEYSAGNVWYRDAQGVPQIYRPRAIWAQGGPIIERERMELRGDGDGGWVAWDYLNPKQYGPTPLIAAMRCYVASKLGAEVEIPDELKGESK